MSARVVAVILGVLALAFARGLIPGLFQTTESRAGLATWLCFLFPLFLLGDPVVTLTCAGVVMAASLAVLAHDQRIAYFFIVVPALPTYISYAIPFPAISYIFTLTHYRLVSLMLLPMLFLAGPYGRSSRRMPWVVADVLFIAYVAYAGLTVSWYLGLTSGLRSVFEDSLTIAVPYFLIRRLVVSVDVLKRCLVAIFVVSVVLACVAWVSTARSWDFYRFGETISVFSGTEYRNGFIRIFATSNVHSTGYHVGVGLLLLPLIARYFGFGWFRMVILAAILGFAMFVTGSRGAWISVMTGIALSVTLSLRSVMLRRAALGGYLVALIAGGFYLVLADFSAADEFGNFDYRQRLLEISLLQLRSAPWFGDYLFWFNPIFEELRQGQGIIDITNMYLEIALPFGSIGAALLFLPVFLTIAEMIGACRPNVGSSAEMTAIMAVLCAALGGWCVLVGTTSSVGLTLYLGIALAGLGRAALAIFRASEKRPAQSVAVKDQE